MHQKTANYPGVTVEKYSGYFYHNQEKHEIIDLPGIYSLFPDSLEEKIAVHEILFSEYDGIILVLNAEQIQKSLLLALQILELKKPTLVVLNMIDEAEKRKINIDTAHLSKLLDTEIVCTNARNESDIDLLKNKIQDLKISNAHFHELNLFQNRKDIANYKEFIEHNLNKSNSEILHSVEKDLEHKNQLVKYIVSKAVKQSTFIENHKKNIDYFLTHPFYGFVFLIITLLIVFQLVFFIAEYPMEWIESVMNFFAGWSKEHLPGTEWASLIVNGIIPGITGVIMFVPQIALLFLMIGILEESGYMARISFLLDSIFSKFGLSGKSLIPLVSGVACAVPSVLSARTITSFKEKLITVMVLPFMSCSARLPVYTLLIGLIFPDEKYFGFFNLNGLILLALYLLGLLMALFYAMIFNKILRQKQYNLFFIELPSYKIPYWKNLLMIVWNKVKIFITDAGKIILSISIILWYLSTHTFPSIQKDLNIKYSQQLNNETQQKEYQKELLENSYIGIIGKKIEPLIAPLGYDWKIGIALVTSFAAREVFVGTMATLYSSNADDDVISLREKIKNAERPDGTKVFNNATNFSLLVYYALAMQCISTMVVVYRELKSFKWMILQFIMMTGTAYLLAFLTYQIFSP